MKSTSRPEGIGSGVGVLSPIGEPVLDMMEETERRFVRAGVRTRRLGGPLELDVRIMGGGEACLTLSTSSSAAVAGCLSAVFASFEVRDLRSEQDIRRIVDSLEWH